MAHHAEPMDIDDESDFDNKENTFHHTNVLPRTPCTEKGYEELDVSELNMKLRYSITPASSPMSKSMTHCLDNRYNASTDESLNNTIINEYENNLTRSLNSTLNKTEVKSSKALPLQALPPDGVDSNRTTSVLRPLDSSVAANDITITVSNENEIDNLSFPSSSSSMAQTPEATTPTKEISKQDGGSPIMRGLKSVLSMFRSSQSPIPPGEEEAKALDTALSPNPLPESKPQAVASTPKHENNKEKSLSHRNSPLKESIVFNEDLEKELQWNDDSTIVFSTEKIPIHKLFFQEKSSKSTVLTENVKHEDANSTVEYMDVSYNDLSIRDKTLNGTVNKSKADEPAELDGEFVDCETTFTQNDSYSNKEEATAKINNDMPNVPEQELVKNIAVVNESHTFDITKDIINLLDSSHTVVEGDLAKKLDFSTTDIVNQLSDLINETSETIETNVTSIKITDALILNNTETLNDVQSENIQPEFLQNEVTSSVNPVNAEDNVLTAVAEQVSIQNENSVDTAGANAVISDVESIHSQVSLADVDADFLKMPQVSSETPKHDETVKNKPLTENKMGTSAVYPSPVDIPLPNEDDINDVNDNLLEDIVHTEEPDKTIPVTSTPQNALMTALDKSITEATNDIQYAQVESQNNVITCPSSLLPTDVPLPNTDENNLVKTDSVPHEAMTVVFAPVHSAEIVQPDVIPIDIQTTKVHAIIEVVTTSDTEVTDGLPPVLTQPEFTTTDSSCPLTINLPSIDENNQIKTNDMPQGTTTIVPGSGKPDIMAIEENTSKVDSFKEVNINKRAESNYNEIETAAVHIIPADLIKPEQQQHMEIYFADPINENESLAMDVSMVDGNINVESGLCQKYQSFHSIPELPETTPVDVVATTNLSHVEIPTETENCNIVSHNETNEIINKGIAIQPESITAMGKGVTINDASKCYGELKENVFVLKEIVLLENLKTYNINSESVTLSNANKLDDVSSSIFETCQLPSLPETNKDVANFVNEPESVDILKLKNTQDVVSDLNLTSTIVKVGTPSYNKQEAIEPHLPEAIDKKSICEVKDDIAVQELPIDSDVTVNLDSTDNAKGTQGPEAKIDEEIVLSEGNSPFVSMSAEEEFEPESKREEFENQFSTKFKVAQSPPSSPKIISKGYNLNFDDIDNIDPFATKTKIRMSPPSGLSPNTSLLTENVNKTVIIEDKKTDKNINRRKSMPERKKPLKAKRHLNSTFDSTESLSPQTYVSKHSDAKITSKLETNKVQSQENEPDLNKTDSHDIDSSTQAVNPDKLDVSMTVTHEDTPKEPEPTLNVNDLKEDAIVKPEDETCSALSNEAKVIKDVVMSDSCNFPIKPDVTSSFEQSAYFSAGTSSTVITESKNVFNLPELDDRNPFVTKSKIRQSPSRDLDTDNPFATKSKIKSSPETLLVDPHNDPNSTVTIANENKVPTSNLSNCSGSSKTSDEKDVTVQEVHTEDEDTLEGPFLEAEDDKDAGKLPELPADKVDMVDINPQENEEAAEMFIDAEAFEFLMNQNKTDEVAYSGKESLFLKFDPLFARRVTSEGVAAALNEIKRKQSTPKKTPKQGPPKEVDFLSFEKPLAGPSDLNKTHDVPSAIGDKSDDMNVTVSKPMMAVTPAVNPVVTPRKSLTPNRSNRLSMTFTSPAMAVIDRLLSLSGNSPSAGLDTTVTQIERPHNEADQALTQLRELLAEKEIHVYNLRCESKELKIRLSSLENQMKTLEAESAERLKKVNELNENLAEKTKMNRNMAAVVEEYERTIASLISETEQDKKRFAEERNQLIRDRDEQTAHLASMEVSFNDLHSKYEKSKQVIMGYKTDEEAYKKSIQEFEDNLAKMYTNYELLKQHATSKLNHANQELEKINKAHEAEILKFNAMIKRKELHITSLEESLAQKTKANEELTAICDELINKVG